MSRPLVVLLLGLLLAGCVTDGRIGGLLVVEGRHLIGSDETLYGDLYVLDGQVRIGTTARVTGSIFVLGGDVRVDGRVEGDVAVVGGEVSLTDTAIIVGGLRRGGGAVTVDPAARVGDELVSPVAVDAVIGLTRPAADAGGPSPWLAAQLLVLALVAAGITRLAPRAVARTAGAVAARPLVPIALGVLALVVGISLLVFMVFTVVLVPVALLLVISGLAGTLVGFVGLGTLAADRILGPTRMSSRRSLRAAIGTAGLALVVGLLAQVPVLGEATVGAAVAASLGAWLVTRFGTRPLELEPA